MAKKIKSKFYDVNTIRAFEKLKRHVVNNKLPNKNGENWMQAINDNIDQVDDALNFIIEKLKQDKEHLEIAKKMLYLQRHIDEKFIKNRSIEKDRRSIYDTMQSVLTQISHYAFYVKHVLQQ